MYANLVGGMGIFFSHFVDEVAVSGACHHGMRQPAY